MMLEARNLKFADLNSLRRFSPFSRMPKELNLHQKTDVSVAQQKGSEFSLDPAIETKINVKHTQLANEWRNQDSKASFQILNRLRP